MPIEILMPALSPTMTEGNLVTWLKKEGDRINAGDVIAEIETDKATMEVEAVDEGVLGKILVQAGTDDVPVNKLIGLILEEGEDKKVLKGYKVEEAEAPKEMPVQKEAANDVAEPMAAAAPEPAPVSFTPAPSPSQERILASPLAKRLASQAGLDLQHVQGSGPKGRIVKADIEKASAGGFMPSSGNFQSSRPAGEMPSFKTVALTNVRKVTAKRLTEAKQQVPHFYLTVDLEVSKLLEARQDINDSLGAKIVSVNDMIIKACALALRKVPEANSAWMGDHIRQFDASDISVAVAIPGGLITPVIRDAEQKSVVQIAKEGKELFQKARDGKLRPEEFQGGTFSLSNLGMYGIQHFGAIINPPQGCIMAVGAASDQPIVRNGEITVGKMMSATLSVDHRVVDGAVGSEFLKAFKDYIAKPISIVL